jgi:hypothetical protein
VWQQKLVIHTSPEPHTHEERFVTSINYQFYTYKIIKKEECPPLGKRKNFSTYSQKRKEAFIIRKALLTHSLHDPINAEIVYTPQHATTVLKCMRQELGYTITDLAEPGEVLIHPSGESPSLTIIN